VQQGIVRNAVAHEYVETMGKEGGDGGLGRASILGNGACERKWGREP
jgi:hypothetical protein